RAGASGAAAWDLDDAMHNKVWGMWNIVDEPAPRPWYYAWSLLSRYFPAGALPHFTASKPFGSYVYSEQSPPGNLDSLPSSFVQRFNLFDAGMKVQVPANGLLLVSNLDERWLAEAHASQGRS
ncbi:MAG TPA: hypothetical protein VFV38_05780, partial [Ktedonobacteraceae bacterium]|nr:hypothetical protein [Ktedonobacteraceae bacterium]